MYIVLSSYDCTMKEPNLFIDEKAILWQKMIMMT